MKLIHCPHCHDVVRLVHTKWRMCECKKSGGQYNEDLMSATIGGGCDVIGIPNPFFDEINKYLIEENGGKDFYRKKHGWGKQDIWYGGGQGDKQICKIQSPKGPRLSMKVEQIDPTHTKSTFTDKRNYTVDGELNPKNIIVENIMRPSFSAPKKLIKKKKTNIKKK